MIYSIFRRYLEDSKSQIKEKEFNLFHEDYFKKSDFTTSLFNFINNYIIILYIPLFH